MSACPALCTTEQHTTSNGPVCAVLCTLIQLLPQMRPLLDLETHLILMIGSKENETKDSMLLQRTRRDAWQPFNLPKMSASTFQNLDSIRFFGWYCRPSFVCHKNSKRPGSALSRTRSKQTSSQHTGILEQVLSRCRKLRYADLVSGSSLEPPELSKHECKLSRIRVVHLGPMYGWCCYSARIWSWYPELLALGHGLPLLNGLQCAGSTVAAAHWRSSMIA